MKESTQNFQEHGSKTENLIINAYVELTPRILMYIKSRINNHENALDIMQDSFVKLIEYKQMLRKETVNSFIFTIVRNLVIDYIRKQYRKQEVSANMYEFSKDFVDVIESDIHAKEILKLESGMLMTLPNQRRLVYSLDRFEEKSADEISEILQISKRTVESHLYISRKKVREYLQNCI